MPLLSTLASLSQTPASNAADGSVDAPSTLDNQVNLLASFIAQLRDGIGFTGQLGSKNRLLNGNFAVNQRAFTGSVVLTVGQYGHDRWKAGAAGCTYTFSTTGLDTTITIAAGSLLQVVEALNVEGGNYVLSWAGTGTAKIGAGSFSASGVTAISVTAASNLNVELSTGTFTRLQLEPGLIASAFERRSWQRELADCRRYYYRNTGQVQTLLATGLAFSATNAAFAIPLPTQMRTSPILTSTNLFPTNGVGALVAPTASAIGSGSDSILVQITVSSGLTVGQASLLYAGNGAGGFIAFDAEI